MIRVRGHGRGQVIVLFCLALFVLMGFLALAVDVGLLWTDRRAMQTAADAAAIAGINALQSNISCTAGTSPPPGSTTTDNCPVATDVAGINGYTVGGPNTTSITVALPASIGGVSGTYVQVSVKQVVPTYFMRALGALFPGTNYNTVNVGATAVAGYVTGSGCVIGLNTSAQNTINVSGSASINAPNCNTIDNSNASSAALVTSGSGTIKANAIGVVGTPSGTGFTPTPTTVAPIADPLGYLTAPALGICKNDADATTASSGNGGTIGPGTYCGGIKVQGGHTLTLTTGLYIINGGGLTVSSSTINGSGVSIFNTGTASGTTGYKAIDISGGSNASLSAPTSQLTGVTGGPWEGILFFQDRNVCNANSSFCDSSGHTSGNQNTLSGGSGAGFQGILYFPNTPVMYSGGSSSTGYTSLIADAVTISGPSSFGSDYSTLTDGSPVKTTALYE